MERTHQKKLIPKADPLIGLIDGFIHSHSRYLSANSVPGPGDKMVRRSLSRPGGFAMNWGETSFFQNKLHKEQLGRHHSCTKQGRPDPCPKGTVDCYTVFLLILFTRYSLSSRTGSRYAIISFCLIRY